jgi:hypothetical protein
MNSRKYGRRQSYFYVFFAAAGYQLLMSVVGIDCRLYVAVGVGCLQLVVGC